MDVEPKDHPTDPHYAWITGLPPYVADDQSARIQAQLAADELLRVAKYPG